MEELLTTSFPHRLVHDGSRNFQTSEGEHQSLAFSRLYHLFPKGMPGQIVLDEFFKPAVKVRFAYDRRYGDGSMRISKRDMLMLGNGLTGIMSKLELYPVTGEDNGH